MFYTPETLALPHLTPVHSTFSMWPYVYHPIPPFLCFCCLFLEFPSRGEGYKKERNLSSVALSVHLLLLPTVRICHPGKTSSIRLSSEANTQAHQGDSSRSASCVDFRRNFCSQLSLSEHAERGSS